MHPQHIPEGDSESVDEKIVLSALMLEDSQRDGAGKLLTKYQAIIEPEWFKNPHNRMIFDIILKIRNEGGVASVTSVGSEVISRNQPNALYHLADISTSCGSPYIELPWHLKRMVTAYMRRVLSREAYSAANALSSGEDIDEKIKDLRMVIDRIENLDTEAETESGSSAKELALALVERAQKWSDNPESGFGWPTGIEVLEDHSLRIYNSGQYLVVAGEPNVGKSTLAAQITLNLARHFSEKGLPDKIGVLSIEDGRERWVERAISNLSKVHLGVIRKGAMSKTNQMAFQRAILEFQEFPLIVETHPNLGLDQLPNVVERMKSRSCSVIVVDFLQEISHARAKDPREKVSAVSRMLKGLAVSEQLSMIVVSSLRKLDGRRPTMDDLKESGDIAFNATEIIALREIQRGDTPAEPNMIGIDILKQKDGPKGDGVALLFGSTFRIESCAQEYESAEQPPAKDNWKANNAKRRR